MAATVLAASPALIVASVPSGATTGPIGVTSPIGSATSGTSFTVGAGSSGAPSITSFTPAIAIAGTAVIITGTNFDTTLANDRVSFNVMQSAQLGNCYEYWHERSFRGHIGSHLGIYAIDDGPMSAALIEGSRIHLQFARAWHTSMMLPDGKILIVGGMGAAGQPVDTAEIFNPDTQTSDLLTANDPRSSISPRVYHTATLLTEGLVLISGGVSGKGDALRTAELWDFRTRVATKLRSKLKTARYNHAATLLANSKVLLSGGSDKNGANLENAELYDPQTQRFTKANPGADNDPQSSIPNPRLSGSLPEDGSTNVPPDALIALRFSKSLRVETVNTESVTLNGPYGRVETKVVPAEGGMLAFVTPKSSLFPGAAYTVSVSGPTDTANVSLADSAISFSTAPARAPIRGFDDEEWIPDSRSGQGDWQSGRSASAWQSLPPLQAPPGVTALAAGIEA